MKAVSPNRLKQIKIKNYISVAGPDGYLTGSHYTITPNFSKPTQNGNTTLFQLLLTAKYCYSV